MLRIEFSARKYRRIFCLVAVLAISTRLLASDLRPQDTALRFIPADAAFFTTSLQLEPQLTRLLESRAVAKLKKHPFIQMALQQAGGLWQSRSGQLQQLLEVPENRELGELLKDIVSHEVFIYGDDRFAVWLATVATIGNDINELKLRIETRNDGELDQDEFVSEILARLGDTDL